MSEWSATDMLMKKLEELYPKNSWVTVNWRDGAVWYLIRIWEERPLSEWEYNIAEALVMMALENERD